MSNVMKNGKQKALGVVVLTAGFLLIISGVASNAIYLTTLGIFIVGAVLGYIEGFRQAKQQLSPKLTV
jgi:hypothetical protein